MTTNWRKLYGDFFEGSRVLVTGGAGFIGSHLCAALYQLGADVVAFDDLSTSAPTNLDGCSVELVQGSILDTDSMKRCSRGCCFIFHQAAIPSVPRSVEQPVRFHEVNTTGTLNVLEAARVTGVQRVMFAASSSAYGDAIELPKIETMPPLPKSPYAANKLAGEHLMRAYANCYDLDTASLRYFNIFGPRQDPNSPYTGVIAIFSRAILNDQQPTIYGDGSASRDFTYIDNAVHANLLAARRTEPINGEVINVGCGHAVTIKQLAIDMAKTLGKPHLEPTLGPPRIGDVDHSYADISRAKSMLKYEPIVNFTDGLAQTIQWYQQTIQ